MPFHRLHEAYKSIHVQYFGGILFLFNQCLHMQPKLDLKGTCLAFRWTHYCIKGFMKIYIGHVMDTEIHRNKRTHYFLLNNRTFSVNFPKKELMQDTGTFSIWDKYIMTIYKNNCDTICYKITFVYKVNLFTCVPPLPPPPPPPPHTHTKHPSFPNSNRMWITISKFTFLKLNLSFY